MKTSKAYFERFKKEFLRWQKELGLTQYRIKFYHIKLDGMYAQTHTIQKGKLVNVALSTDIEEPKFDEGPESHARHEALHLLLSRLSWIAECRYIEDSDIGEEEEAIVVRLEKVIK